MGQFQPTPVAIVDRWRKMQVVKFHDISVVEDEVMHLVVHRFRSYIALGSTHLLPITKTVFPA